MFKQDRIYLCGLLLLNVLIREPRAHFMSFDPSTLRLRRWPFRLLRLFHLLRERMHQWIDVNVRVVPGGQSQKSVIDMRSKKAIREGNYDDDMMTRTHNSSDDRQSFAREG
jgi:hypothetical protein